MKQAQRLWADPEHINYLQGLWRLPSSIESRRIIGQLAGAYRYPNTTVLDVGCGAGRMAGLFKHAKYKGSDSSREMVKICKAKGLNVSLGSVCKIQEPDKSVDLVICHAVLLHVGSVNEGIQELWRVTKGRLIYSLYYMPLFSFTKAPPFIHLRFNHRGAMPTWSEDRDNGLGWWSVQNILPAGMVTRFIKKYIKPRHHSCHWYRAVGPWKDKMVFCVLDR